MKKEDKELLLIDFCARLPYGVKCRFEITVDKYKTIEFSSEGSNGLVVDFNELYCYWFNEGFILPYLRPMSSMTEVEEVYYNTVYTTLKFYEKEDWLNAHHFDYRGLIPMGLALEALEGMYKTDFQCSNRILVMTQEEKELLLKDLSARLPYEVKCRWITEDTNLLGIIVDIVQVGYDINDYDVAAVEDIIPYLRSMSSMTEEEKMEWFQIRNKHCNMSGFNEIQERADFTSESLDWLNKKMFDYRGLIEKGLAFEASEGMYNNI